MEFRELIQVFIRNSKLFFTVLAIFIFAGVAFYFFQPKKMIANMMLNVTRKGVQNTQDYKYDDFYRLQADERFADTVVRWISSPNISREISKRSSLGKEMNIKAERLSSQMIEITFLVKNSEEAMKYSRAIEEVLIMQTEKLNDLQKEENWFYLVANPIEVLNGEFPFKMVFPAALLAGLFFASLSVMIKNYMEG